MANYQLTSYGVKITVSDPELKILTAALNGGAQATVLVASALAIIGITAPGSVIATVTAALIGMTSTGLTACNYNGKGIYIFVLWIGVPWCKTQ